jgi:hypothetical protein
MPEIYISLFCALKIAFLSLYVALSVDYLFGMRIAEEPVRDKLGNVDLIFEI